MALPDGVRVNADGDVTFSGRSGQMLLSHVLLRAKFARPFEPIALLNGWMAELAIRLDAGLWPERAPPTPGTPLFADDPRVRWEIAEAILMEADHSGWWTWSPDQRAAYVRDVACAPHPVSDETVEEILLTVEDRIAHARRLVAAANSGA